MCGFGRIKSVHKVAMAGVLVIATLLLNAVWPAVVLDHHPPTRAQAAAVLAPGLDNMPAMDAETLKRMREVQESLRRLEQAKQNVSHHETARNPMLRLAAADPAKKKNGAPVTPQLPHILFILSDDLGNDDLSIHQPLLHMPVLHDLASRGLYLQNYYSQSLCSPSRAALNTGRYPARFGMQSFVLLDEQVYGMDLNETTLPQSLKTKFGYRTHLLGKWHLGYHSWRRTPTFRGYDSFHGYYSGQGTYVTHEAKYFDYHLDTSPDKAAIGVHSHELYVAHAREVLRGHSKNHAAKPLFLMLALQSPHSPHEVPDRPYVEFYRQHGRFRNTSLTSEPSDGVHTSPPMSSTNSGAQSSSVYEVPGMRQQHAALLTYMDETIGRVIALFKEFGMWEDNTLLIFASDNGGCVTDLAPGCEGGASNFPFRGEKGSLYEGGVHVPAFLFSESKQLLPPQWRGRTSVETIHVADWRPTIEGILHRSKQSPRAVHGKPLSASIETTNFDGIDAWVHLENGATCPSRPHLRDSSGALQPLRGPLDHSDKALRQLQFSYCSKPKRFNRTLLLNHDPHYEGSALISWPWKLIFHTNFVENSGWSVRDGGMDFAMLAQVYFSQVELFNLDTDPGETINVAHAEPLVVEAMRDMLVNITADFAMPKAPPAELDYFLGDPLAGWLTCASC